MCELQVRLCDEITTSRCDCCGDVSRRVWGEVQAAGTTVAVYFVHWTVGHIFDYGAHFDLILGPRGDDTSAADRRVVRLHHRLDKSGVMVVDARDEFRTVAAHALTRCDVIGTPAPPRSLQSTTRSSCRIRG